MSDLIDRQAAIDAVCEHGTDLERRGITVLAVANHKQVTIDLLDSLPSVQPEIIYCKDCVKHNKGHGYYLDGTVIGIKDCCPLVEIRGMAQGHEFDYQYCAYAERRTDG